MMISFILFIVSISFIKNDGANIAIKNIIEYHIGSDIETINSIKEIIIILDYKGKIIFFSFICYNLDNIDFKIFR